MLDFKVITPNKSLTAVRLERLPAVSDIKKVNIAQLPYINDISKVRYMHNASGAPLVYTTTYPIRRTTPFISNHNNKDWKKVTDKGALQNNTNDSTQLNSLVDVFYGGLNSIAGLFTGNPDGYAGFKKGHYSKKAGWLNKIPLINTLIRLNDYVYSSYTKPISKGEWSITGLNLLQAVGEDADWLSNIIKGAVIETATGFKTGDFKNHNPLVGMSQGMVSNSAGRKTYTYDIDPEHYWDGSINLALEAVSDPMNWLTLGTKQLVVEGLQAGEAKIAKAFIDSGLDTVVKEAGEETSKQWMKGIIKNVARSAITGTEISAEAISEQLLKSAGRRLGTEAASQITTEAIQQVGKVVAEIAQTTSERMSMNIVRSLIKVDDIATAPSKAILIAPFKTIKQVKKIYNTRLLRSLEPFLKGSEEVLDILDYDKLMTHVSDTTDALAIAAEQSGVKGLQSGTIRNLVTRNTRNTIAEIQDIIFHALHNDKTKIDFKAIKEEILKYLVDKKGWDSSKTVEEWFAAYTQAINKLAAKQSTFKKLVKPMQKLGNKLTAINKNIALQQSPQYLNMLLKLKFAEDLFKNAKQLQQFIDKSPEEIINMVSQAVEDAKKATSLFKSLDTSEATLTIQRECAAQIAEIYLHGTRQLDNHQLDTIIGIVLTSDNNTQANRIIRNYFKKVLGATVDQAMYNQIYNILKQYTNPNTRAYTEVLKNIFHIDTTDIVMTKDIQNSIRKLIKYVKEGSVESKKFDEAVQSFKDIYNTFIKTETDAVSGKTTKSLIKKSFYKICTWAKNFTDDFNNFTAPVYKEGVREPIVSTKINKAQADFLKRVSAITTIPESVLTDVFKNLSKYNAGAFIRAIKYPNIAHLTDAQAKLISNKSALLTEQQFEMIKQLFNQYSSYDTVVITALKNKLVKPLQTLFGKNNTVATNVSKAIDYYFNIDNTVLQIVESSETESVSKLINALDEALLEIEDKKGLLQSGVATERYDISRLGITDTVKNINVVETIEDLATQIGDVIKARESAFKTANDNLTKLLESFNDNVTKFTKDTAIPTVDNIQTKLFEIFKEQSEKQKIITTNIEGQPEKILDVIAPDTDFIKTTEQLLFQNSGIEDRLRPDSFKTLPKAATELIPEDAPQITVKEILEKDLITADTIKEYSTLLKEHKLKHVPQFYDEVIPEHIQDIKNTIEVLQQKLKTINNKIEALKTEALETKALETKALEIAHALNNAESILANYERVANGSTLQDLKVHFLKYAESEFTNADDLKKAYSDLQKFWETYQELTQEYFTLHQTDPLKTHTAPNAVWLSSDYSVLQTAYKTFIETDYLQTGKFDTTLFKENYRFFRNSLQRIDSDAVLDKTLYNDVLQYLNDIEKQYPWLNESSETKLINVSGDVHYYMLKQEQIMNAQTFIQDEAAMAFIKYMHDGVALTEKDNILSYTNSEYVSTLLKAATTDEEKQAIKTMADAANKVKTACDSIIQYSELVNNINNSTVLSGSRKQAFLSTLMRTDVSAVKSENIYSDVNKINEIITNVERFINGTRQIKKFTLDDFRAQHADLFPESWQTMAHHADTDNITTFKFIETELPDIKLKDTDWAVDIETTSLQANTGEVLEIGFTNKSGQGVLFKRNLNPAQDFVDSSLYDLWYKNLDTPEAKKAAFYNYFNKNYNGPSVAQQVYYFDSEADLLAATRDFYKSGRLKANESNIYMHNGMDFDIPYLKRRATLNGINDFDFALKNYEVIDTYKQIQKKYNFVVLDASEKYEITQLFNEYVAGRISSGHAEEQFINALPSALITGLSDFYKINKEYQKSFFIEGMSDASAITEYDNMAKHLKQLLVNNIKKVNRGDPEAGTVGLNNIVFSADSLNTPEFQQQLYDALYDIINNIDTAPAIQKDVLNVLADFVKAIKDNPQYKEINLNDTGAVLKAYLETMNPSKALYTVPTLIPTLGYKTLWDSKIVNTWFTGYADLLPERQAQQLYNLAAYFERQVKYLVNAKALVPYRDTLDAFLNNIKPYLVSTAEMALPANWEYLIMNSDAVANKYVLAKHIYTTLTTQKQYTPLLEKFKSKFSKEFQNLEELLAQDFRFRHNTVSDTGLTYTEYLTDISKDEWLQANKYYSSLAEELKADADNFSLAEKLDETGLFTPALQATASGAQHCYRLIQDFADIMDKHTLPAQSKIQQQFITVTDDLAVQTLRNLYSDTSVENITKVLAHSYGISTFNIYDAPDVFKTLIKNEQLYNAAGIKLYVDGNTNRVWLYFDKNKINLTSEVLSENHNAVKHIYVNGTEIAPLALKELDVNTAMFKSDSQLLTLADKRKLTDDILKVRDTLHRYSDNHSVGIHGDLMNRKTVRAIYEAAPEAIQKEILDVDAITDNSAWFYDSTYNISNLGSGRYRRQIQQGTPLNLFQTYKVNTQITLQSANAKLKYINYILNGDMRLDVGLWSNLENETALFNYIKAHPEMVVAVPVKHKGELGFDIKRVAINSIEDLRNAKRLKASLLTRETYSKAASVIHTNNFNDGVLGVWSKMATLYKIGQLSVFNLGTLTRNFIDSVVKEVISTGSVIETVRSWHETIKDLSEYKKTLTYCMATEQLDTEMIERIAKAYNVSPENVLKDIEFDAAAVKIKGLKEVINATALYTKYNTCIDDIIKMDSNSILRPQNIEFYFNHIAKDFDIDTFYAVHKFITEGASAGATPELQEVFAKEFAKRGLPNEDSSGLWGAMMHLSRKLSKPNYDLEQIVRLSQHMQQMRQGMSFTDSSYKIAKVHFDYADKTDATRLIELIIPFYNFKMKNFEYWADLIEKNPWVWHLYMDVMNTVWNFDTYDEYGEHLELANNQSLQYNIMAGNIVLNSTGLTLKLNPSIQDAIQMSSDPFGNAQSSLFAPLQYGFKQALYAQAKKNGLPEFFKNTFNISDYYINKKQSFIKSGGLQIIPLVGAPLSRFMVQRPKYYNITKNPLNFAIPSLFGAVKRWNTENIKSPEEWAAQRPQRKQYVRDMRVLPKTYKTYKTYGYNRSNRSSGYSRYYTKKARKPYIPYTKKTYYNSSYPTAFTTYYNPTKQPRKYYPIHYNNYTHRAKPIYARNVYWKYYTKKGKRRMDILTAKTTRKNLQMKIKLMYNYYK